jgi:small subunit ribosomal protein S6
VKRTYECMCLLDNREVRQGWQALKDNVTGMFSKHGADVVSARRWEERRLTFPIKHQQRGTYLLVYFNGEPDMIAPLRRELQLSESIMRNLLVTCEEIPEEAHQPEESFDESQVPVEDLYQPPPPPAADKEEEEVAEEPQDDAGEEAAGEAPEATDAEAKQDDSKQEARE